MSSEEIWKEIPGFPGYDASTHGRIRSWLINGKPGRRRADPVIRKLPNSRGYRVVSLSRNKLKIQVAVHILVLETFVGPCPTGKHEVRHFPDRDRANNKLENLSWGTHQENVDDRAVHGTNTVGRRNPMAKLTDAQVIRMRAMSEYLGYSELASLFGMSVAGVHAVVRRHAWKHL